MLPIPELQAALTGRVRDHQRFMLRQHLVEIDHLDGQIACYDQRIDGVLSPSERAACVKLDAIPGIDRKSAQCLLTEVGVNYFQKARPERKAPGIVFHDRCLCRQTENISMIDVQVHCGIERTKGRERLPHFLGEYHVIRRISFTGI